MPAFVPDVPYHIQGVFIAAFGYIWSSAFLDRDYLQEMPEDSEGWYKIQNANVWRAIISIVIFLCAFSYLKPYPDYELNHWQQRINRVITMLMLIYLSFIIYMLNLRPVEGRRFLGFLDPSLNQPVTKEMHTYDDNCEFELKNIWDNFDHYYVVHLCDWLLASFVLRDTYILHFWQVFDEVVELSWQHILPHFRECWWDHIICDILLSNIPAITFGMYLIHKFNIRTYDWLGREGKKSIWEWEAWHCHKRFGALCYQQGLLCIHFLNGFFLNNAFLIRPKHFFPIARLLLWFGFGAIGFRETYMDVITWGKPERKENPIEGRFRWMSVAVLITEAICCWKYREGTGNLLNDPTPAYIWVPWTVTIVVCTLYWFYLRFKKGHTVKYPGFELEYHSQPSKAKAHAH